jgi:hypothetical protein
MAVHEEHPTSTVQIVVDHLLSLVSLASSKRDLFTLLGHVTVLSESLESSYRVRT